MQSMRHTPTTSAEVEKIVAQAAVDSCPLWICGGGSKRMTPLQPPPKALLDMSALSGITSYDSDELVITALAGTPLLEIQAALDERKQMLAFEPFDHAPLFGEAAGRATLGGIVAANVSGSRRISAGAARDHILGFNAVSGRGEAFKGGGAVVKNVTGFDLPKLMAGSWGTLGVLTSITMRVLPRPRTEKTLLLRGLSDEAANHAMTRAMALPAAVSAAAHVHSSGAVTGLRLEGFGPSVEARCGDLKRALGESCSVELLEAEQSRAFWDALRSPDHLPVDGHSLWRISLPPAHAWKVGGALRAMGAYCVYDWAGGLIWAALPDDSAHAGPAIHDIAAGNGGSASAIRAPVEMRRLRPPATALKELSARVKSAFDPLGLLNPGLDLAAEA